MANCWRCGREVHFDSRWKDKGKWLPLEGYSEGNFTIHKCALSFHVSSRPCYGKQMTRRGFYSRSFK